jgi:type IX secretion system PorP/SprF family membrane protein
MLKNIFLVIFIFFWLVLPAQDISLSQFYSNPLYLNPSFAGTAGVPRVALQYRDQWHSFNNAFNTYSASFDFPVKKLQGGLGFYILNDSRASSSYSMTQIDAAYSVNVRLSEEIFLRGAIQAGLHRYALDVNNLIFPDNVDPTYGNHGISRELEYLTDTDFSFADFSAGLILFNKRYFGGLAVHHLAEPRQTFYSLGSDYGKLARKYTAHFGAKLPVFLYGHHRKKFDISPQFVIQKQGSFDQLNYGILATKWGITAGTWFRQNFGMRYDSVILLVGFFKKAWQLTYTYDITVSGLWGETGGSSEISLVFFFKEAERNRYLPFYNFYEDEFGVQ